MYFGSQTDTVNNNHNDAHSELKHNTCLKHIPLENGMWYKSSSCLLLPLLLLDYLVALFYSSSVWFLLLFVIVVVAAVVTKE